MMKKISFLTRRDKTYLVVLLLGVGVLYSILPLNALFYGIDILIAGTGAFWLLGREENSRPRNRGKLPDGWPWV